MIVVTTPTKPAPLTRTASTSLTEDDHAWLVAECERKGMTKSAYLRRLVLIQRSLHVT